MENSEWLADINNDRIVNDQQKQNMASLNKYMATYATQDTVVQPRDLDQPSWILHCSYHVGHNVQEWHFASRYANAAIARQCDIPDRMPASVSQWDKRVAMGAARF